MHSLVNELARRLNLPPEQVESAIGDILVRVRAALETIGEAEVGGLGTFRSIDGKITFQPTATFVEAVNRDFAGLKPVALTSTGESVDVDDERAIPGSDASFEEPVSVRTAEEELQPRAAVAKNQEPESKPIQEPEPEPEPEPEWEPALDEPLDEVPDVDEVPDLDELEPDLDELEPVTEDEQEEEPVVASTFTSPPPPIPSKIRVPLSERRQRRHNRERAQLEPESAEASTGDIPDMGSVVSTRPVASIHAKAPRKRQRNIMPAAIAAVVIAIALLSWLLIGGGSDDAGQADRAAQVTGEVRTEGVQAAQSAPKPASPQAAVTAQQSLAESVSSAMKEASSKPHVEEPSPEVTLPSPEVVSAPVEQPLPAEPVAEVAQPAPTLSDATFAWIVASYPSRPEAESRVEMLKAEGFDAHVYQAFVGGRTAFRVGVGQFDSEVSALNGRAAVPSEVTDAWVARVN